MNNKRVKEAYSLKDPNELNSTIQRGKHVQLTAALKETKKTLLYSNLLLLL